MGHQSRRDVGATFLKPCTFEGIAKRLDALIRIVGAHDPPN
jgi:hypothetical protein